MLEKQPRKALFYGISTIIMWSAVATALKLSLASLTPFQLIWIGLGVASIILAVILFFTKEYKQIVQLTLADYRTVFLQACLLFAYYYCAFIGYSTLPAQIASALNNSWPFALVFVNLVLFREYLGKLELLGMLIAYSGVALVAFGGSSSALLGASVSVFSVLLMVFGTLFIALFWLIKNRSEINHNVSLFMSFFFCSIFGFLFTIIEGDSLNDVTQTSLYAAIALGVFEWGIPFVTWALALKLTNSVAGIGILSFFTPFLGLLWISLFLQEPILYTTVIGLGLCVSGTLIQQRYKVTKS